MADSELYDESTFYDRFKADLKFAKESIIIESAFMTVRRVDSLLPELRAAIKRNVRIVINTRVPENNDLFMQQQSYDSITTLQDIGVTVLLTVNHHRKLAIIDSRLIWEGSMNILSQSDSCEIMRRIDSETESKKLLQFINLNQWYQ